MKTPTVTVKNGSATLKKNEDYVVSYASGRTNVGTYKVTVTSKGNYSFASETPTFQIKARAVTPTVSFSKASLTYSGKATYCSSWSAAKTVNTK